MTFDTNTATALEIAAAVRARRVSACEVARHAVNVALATHGKLNAFTRLTSDRALTEAAAVDAAVAEGRDPGPLAGVPYAVKNLFDLAGVTTVAGSKIERDAPPARTDAIAVTRLQAAGAVCLGALNMGEYAYDFVTENAHDGATRNPHDLTRSAGGSSGGCGAAVAGGIVPLSLGTDTNGSIRVPSSFCGIWGLKPTFGRLPRTGSFPFVDSLDHIGPFARSVADLCAAYDALQGPGAHDPACAQRSVEPCSLFLETGCSDLRIGVLSGYFEKGGSPEAHAAVAAVAAALGATRRVDLPAVSCARAAAYTITACEGGRRHLENLKSRAGDFDPAARDRLIAGALLPAAWYLQAQKFRAWFREQVLGVFREVDVLLAPATPVSATRLGQHTMQLDGVDVLVRPNLGLFTQPISFVGLPVIAAPVRTFAPLPIGVQLIAAPWREADLFRVARTLERNGVCTAPATVLAT